ncbi:MAG: DUF2505 domain-containing protein [Deltaproteobacteria bacterium]|nr:DUF2505 domain-containing protein [Deltaproteobacteria bacterium]
MRPIEIHHVLPCDTTTFWRSFWDTDYDARLQDKARYTREVLDDVTVGGIRSWRARVIPERTLPGVVQKLLGTDRLIYVQSNRLDQAANRLDWDVVPAVMSDKVTCRGTLQLRDLGDGRCERTVRGSITVSVFGVGGSIERAIADNIVSSYDATAQALEEWLAARA